MPHVFACCSSLRLRMHFVGTDHICICNVMIVGTFTKCGRIWLTLQIDALFIYCTELASLFVLSASYLSIND